MKLPPEKLDEIWWAGFCDETVRHASCTRQGRDGALLRLSWMQHHMPECAECERSNKLKNLEEQVALSLGRGEDFVQGRDTSKAPGYHAALNKVLRDAMARGILTPTDLGWMAQIAKRHGKPWPGHEGQIT